MKYLRSIAFMLAILSSSPLRAQTSTTGIPMTELGTLGGQVSSAYDINRSGHIVGTSAVTGSGEQHAFLWHEIMGMVDLGVPGETSAAYGVNDLGDVVGSVGTEPATRPVLWPADGTPRVELGNLGGCCGAALDINEQGQVVGYSLTASGDVHAFLWSSASGIQDLGTLGGCCSSALAINDVGQVTGWSRAVNPTTTTTHAFSWRVSAGMEDLGTLENSPYAISEGNDINDVSQIAGRVSSSISSERPGLWSETDGWSEIGTLGGFFGTALGINERGWVVGRSQIPNDDQYRAFFWTAEGGILDLGTAGGAFSSAYAVEAFEDDTAWIVGWAATSAPGSPSVAVRWVVDVAPSPEACLEQLDTRVRELVQDGFLNPGQGNALLAKLDATVGGLERGNVKQARNTLTAFINQLEAFDSGAVLPHEIAQELITLAQSCLEAIGEF